MALLIRHVPDNAPDRQWCFCWIRQKDNAEVLFHYSTQADCQKLFAHYKERASRADEKGWDNL